MSLLQSLCPVLDLKIDMSLLKIVLNDSPYSKPWGFTVLDTELSDKFDNGDRSEDVSSVKKSELEEM